MDDGRCFVSHLEAAIDGTRLEGGRVQTLHEGRPLWVRYDLPAIRESLSRDDLTGREPTLWRYRELLPVRDPANIVSLGEGMSPLLDCPRLARELGVERLLIKDESQLPTGSFKSRGMAVAVSMAKEFGIKRVATPTAGNAGGALAAYAARADMQCWVFMPDDTPIINRYEAALLGAKAYLCNGLIGDCAQIVMKGKDRMGWFDMSTLKEPYRIEGKKTMGLELAEQMDWTLPDTIMYPTGGGTGLIGMWKAFGELGELGWLETEARPKMFSCQAAGCPTISSAFDAGERFAEPAANPHTIASGLRVPKAVGDFMILDAVRASGGRAASVPDDVLLAWMHTCAALEGISLCPEAGACLGVLERALKDGHVRANETVVVFNTGAAQKYAEAIECDLPRLDYRDPDWSLIENA